MKKKKIVLMLVVIMFGLFITYGCEDSPNINDGGNGNPSGGDNTTVSRTPSYAELGEAISKHGYTIEPLVNAIKASIASLATINVNDAINYIKGIKEIYGNFIVNDGQNTFTNVADMAQLALYPYFQKNGPIIIIKNAHIVQNGVSTTANIVFLCGTACQGTGYDSDGNAIETATGILEDLQSGMGLTNEYLYDAYYAIYDNLKGEENTPLIISGISLGGMVAQQLAALPAINRYFNVTNVVAIGSPIIAPEEMDYSKTAVQRMVDTVDLVPKLSVYQYEPTIDGYNTTFEKNNAIVITSTYKTFIGSHTLAYPQVKFWNNVDVLGFEGGNATLTFDKLNMTAYEAPKFKQAMSE